MGIRYTLRPALKPVLLQLCSCCCWGSVAGETKLSLETWNQTSQCSTNVPCLLPALQTGNCLPSAGWTAHIWIATGSKNLSLVQEFGTSLLNKSLKCCKLQSTPALSWWMCVSTSPWNMRLIGGCWWKEKRNKRKIKKQDRRCIKKCLSFSCWWGLVKMSSPTAKGMWGYVAFLQKGGSREAYSKQGSPRADHSSWNAHFWLLTHFLKPHFTLRLHLCIYICFWLQLCCVRSHQVHLVSDCSSVLFCLSDQLANSDS